MLRYGAEGAARMGELLFISMFAGVVGIVGILSVTLKHMSEEPAERKALYRKDPEAYVLEAARLFPSVAGMTPHVESATQEVEVAGSCGAYTMREGAEGFTIPTGPNYDPAVFDDADAFTPGRENADRLMTWNAELRDIRDGSAPRGCPGTHLSLRVLVQAVGFFSEGM